MGCPKLTYQTENKPIFLKVWRKSDDAVFEVGRYDYGARFYDPQIGRFTTQDRFAEKYLDFTPYQYGANNPLLFIDVNGDSIYASQAFIKDEKIAGAMKAILGSKAGYAYFSKFAAKGDNLFGFEFESDGEFSANGIDLSLDVAALGYKNGDTDVKESENGFDISIRIDPGENQGIFDVAETIVHEGLLEANYRVNDVKDGKKDYSNISSYVKKDWLKGDISHYAHGQNYLDRKSIGGERLIWPGTAYRILQDVNKSINSGLSDQQIQNKMSDFWWFYGNLFGK